MDRLIRGTVIQSSSDYRLWTDWDVWNCIGAHKCKAYKLIWHKTSQFVLNLWFDEDWMTIPCIRRPFNSIFFFRRRYRLEDQVGPECEFWTDSFEALKPKTGTQRDHRGFDFASGERYK